MEGSEELDADQKLKLQVCDLKFDYYNDMDKKCNINWKFLLLLLKLFIQKFIHYPLISPNEIVTFPQFFTT